MKRLTSNFLSIIGSDVARRVLGFFTIAYLARIITTADFGAINIGYTILSYALMISSGGLNTFGAREVARSVSMEFVNSMLSLRFVAALLVYGIVSLVTISCIPSTDLASLVMVFCLSLFAHAVLLDWFFQGKEEMGIVGIGRFASAAVYLVLIVVFVRSSSALKLVAVAAVVGDVVATIILLLFYSKRNRGVRFHFSSSGWKLFLAQAFPLGTGSMLAHFSVNLPPLVIGIFLTNADVGIYSAASKMVFFLLMFDRVLATLLLPASARLHAYSPEALSSTLNAALRWILIVALPLSVGGTLLAERLITVVFGAQYQLSAIVFQVLIWYFFFTMIHTIYTSGIVVVGKEREYSRVMIISAIIYGISVIVCTKLFGVIGGAAAVVGSEAITLILMRRSFHESAKTVLPKSLPLLLLAAVIMGVVLMVLPSMHLILSVLVGAGVYAIVLMGTRAVTIADVLALVRRA